MSAPDFSAPREGCPFCGYAALPDPTYAPLVLEHDRVLRLLVVRPPQPATVGHVMFVPLEHIDVDPRGRWASSRAVAHALDRVMSAAAHWADQAGHPFNLVLQVGREAGQSLDHLHFHYVPRAAGDGLGYRWDGAGGASQ